MSLTSFLVSRNWASERLRTALTLLGIAFGTAVVVAIYVMDHNTIQSRMRQQHPERGPVDVEVTPLKPRPAEDVRKELKGHAGVSAVAIWREGRGVAVKGGGAVALQVFGLDPLPGGVFSHYVVEQGQDLSSLDGDSAILLGQGAAQKLKVQPGDRIELQEVPPAQRTVCKDGKMTVLPPDPMHKPVRVEVVVKGVLGHHRLGRKNVGDMLVCSHALAAKLEPHGQDLFQLQRTYGADLDRLRQNLGPGYRAVDLRAAMIGEGADERSFRNGIKVLGCLALLLGMFVVFQTLSHSLIVRVRQLGLLRCLGVSRGALVRIFLGDALALGVVGSALGIGLGLLLALLLQANKMSSLGLNKEWDTFEVPLAPVLWTGVLGVVFTLAGASFPLWRARSLTPLAVLQARGIDEQQRDLLKGVNLWLLLLLVLVLPLAYLAMTPLVSEEGWETLIVLLELAGLLTLFGGVLLVSPVLVGALGRAVLWPLQRLLPLPAWLVSKAVRRGGGRVAAGVCGLAAVLMALLGLKGLTASLEAEVISFAAQALDGRVFLEGAPMTPAAARQALAGVAGVRRVELQEGFVKRDFWLAGLAPEAAAAAGGALERFPDAMREYADPDQRALIISQRLAAKMHWRRGSLVPQLDQNGKPVVYKVVLVSDGSGHHPDERAWAVTAPRWLHQDFCVPEQSVERVTLWLEPSANPDIVVKQASQLLPGYKAGRTGDWFREYHQRDVTRDFRLFDVLLFLMLLLAGVGLLNGMTIAALGRNREFGVLRALGMAPRALRTAFLLEGALVAVLAAGLALLVCPFMVRVLIAGLNRIAGTQAPVELPVAWMIVTPFLALLVGVLAAVVPALQSQRHDPAEAVRYE